MVVTNRLQIPKTVHLHTDIKILFMRLTDIVICIGSVLKLPLQYHNLFS